MSKILDFLVQYLPHWFIRHYPLNKWYHVESDWEDMLRNHKVGKDWIVECDTGLLHRGSRKVQ